MFISILYIILEVYHIYIFIESFISDLTTFQLCQCVHHQWVVDSKISYSNLSPPRGVLLLLYYFYYYYYY
jgi:hypothetical protein